MFEHSIRVYGTAQFQGNVRTRLECMRGTSGTHAEPICNACRMRPEHAQDASVQVQNLAVKLQQDLGNSGMPFFAGHGMRPECMQYSSGMHAGHVWDMCECYLGAELYRINLPIS